MPDLKWGGEWPEEVKGAVEPVISSLLWFCPPWCHQISLYYRSTDAEDVHLSCTPHYDYRYLYMVVHAGWMNGGSRERFEDMVHELLHAFLGPVTQYTDTVIETLMPDAPQFRSTVKEQLRERTEGAICDLAYRLAHRLTEKE